MSDPFVPFFSGPERETRNDSRFEVLVVPQGRDEAAPTSVAGTGAAPIKAIPSANSHANVLGGLAPSSSPHAGGCTAGPARTEPEITLDREGDRIVRITVRCSCGQVMELNCTY